MPRTMVLMMAMMTIVNNGSDGGGGDGGDNDDDNNPSNTRGVFAWRTTLVQSIAALAPGSPSPREALQAHQNQPKLKTYD